MLVKKEFKGNTRGRDNKYPFSELEVGSCLIIEIPYSKSTDVTKFRTLVSSALYHWKRYNGHEWRTAVRLENDKISVYRIS